MESNDYSKFNLSDFQKKALIHNHITPEMLEKAFPENTVDADVLNRLLSICFNLKKPYHLVWNEAIRILDALSLANSNLHILCELLVKSDSSRANEAVKVFELLLEFQHTLGVYHQYVAGAPVNVNMVTGKTF